MKLPICSFLFSILYSIPLVGSAQQVLPVGKTFSSSLSFLENKGQITDQFQSPRTDIQFSVPLPGLTVFIGSGKIHYQFFQVLDSEISSISARQSNGMTARTSEAKPSHLYRMDVELLGANGNAIVLMEQKESYRKTYHSSISNGSLDAYSYKKIMYKNIYPQIDWVLYIKDDHLEYEFVVHPGGNPADIKIRYNGASNVVVNDNGSLSAATPLGVIQEKSPVSYQQDGQAVATSFQLKDGVLGFQVASYRGTLVLDPAISWSTYYGGPLSERFNSVTLDEYGGVYASGFTCSISNIATIGAYQTVLAGTFDGVLSKFNTSGNLIWSTYYGALGNEYFVSVNCNATSVYVAGETVSNNDHNSLLVKFDSSGQFIWDQVFGGFGYDQAICVTTDPVGSIYLCGTTESPGLATPGAFQTVMDATGDAFLTRIDPSGNIVWFTYFGGAGFDEFDDLKIDAGGNITGIGGSMSSGLNTIGPAYSNATEAVVFKFDNAGNRIWSTYFGGPGGDYPYGLALDQTDNIFVTGITNSQTGIASGSNIYQPALSGTATDAFIAKFDNSGGLQWGSYFGGPEFEQGRTIKCTVGGEVIFGGSAASLSDIAIPGTYQDVYGGGSMDGFLARFSSSGSNVWSTYFGGNDMDFIMSVAVDAGDNVFLCGYSESFSGISTSQAFQLANNGNGDGFLAKFTNCSALSAPAAITGASNICAGQTETYSVAPVAGATYYTWTLPSGFTGSATTNSITVTAGNTGGSVTVSAGSNCTVTGASSLPVNVFSPVVASIALLSNSSFCVDDSLVLNANTGAGLSYTWLLDGVAIPLAASDTLHAKQGGVYSVIIDPGGGCVDTSSGVSLTTKPLPALPSATNNSPVCPGSSIEFSVTTATANVVFSWIGPSSFAAGIQNPVIPAAAAANAGIYTATVTLNGCSVSDTTEVALNPGSPVMPGQITGSQGMCIDSTETYSVVNNPSVISYTWSLPPGWTGSGTSNNIMVTAGATSGFINVVANNNCGSSNAQSVAISVSSLSPVIITKNGALLTTSGIFGGYQWYYNGNLINGATGQSYVYDMTGDYYVIATDGICSVRSNTISIVTGIDEVAWESGLLLYPNPNLASFVVSGTIKEKQGAVLIKIITVQGVELAKIYGDYKDHLLNIPIQLKDASPGIYFLKLETAKDAQWISFIVLDK